MLYFDHNATHPLSATARRVWLEAAEKFPGNPSSPHRMGQRAEKALDDARERLAALLGCSAEEIVFTSGATEAANMALAPSEDVVISAIEHPCVREAGRSNRREARVDAQGVVDLDDFRRQLTARPPQLAAVMAANNETGVLQPWREAYSISREVGVPFFCDAAQWIGKMPAAGLGACDFVGGCAHKFGGPVGVGFLKCPRNSPPLLRGGPQESGRRAGTENVPGILAMVAALEEAEQTMALPAGLAQQLAMRENFERALLAALPGVRVLGDGAERLWNTISILMPEAPDCRRRWVVVMDKLGFAVSTGSACASGKEKPSHVLTAMGITAADAGRALRCSAGWTTSADDWAKLLTGLQAAAAEMGV